LSGKVASILLIGPSSGRVSRRLARAGHYGTKVPASPGLFPAGAALPYVGSMSRFAIVSLIGLVLAACAAGGPEQPRVLTARAALEGPEAAVVEVRVTEIPPGVVVERILMIGPGGQRLDAEKLARSTSESGPGLVSRPGIGIAVTGGSSSGVNPSVSLGWHATGGGPGRHSQQITARIPLPSPAAYRAAGLGWRVEVHYSDVTGRRQVLTLPAPRFE
ncbi:MAG: hypothetical protein OES41_03440, partial [Rhodospirillales bacterium]|nr:hypothetical protein [Rhodospirillales bacterium]